ncbi:GTP-binding protein [Allonocardiopsis opalescens]|uniref:Signal recognition particle receptor subunit beta n=1 Tax=Allonocardiopsis opalescens TaxID=1144618 RepID=A0A2T0PVX3_9ACTN|nr:ATP/GTP-binding protein [Allonocardiopsis opalescens]PRX95682.1 hypothetical protein CLV72_109293 [Allonocardiopsis opalescens]
MISTKIVIAGGFGVGKTTLVGAVSEIPPVTTEAAMTPLALGGDDVSQIPDKASTTVAMDFGRITLDDNLVLYLFGTPGQSRFWFMWDDLVKGALGAIVLADIRRLDDCFPAIDYFEKYHTVPYIIAFNTFDGHLEHSVDDIRTALAIGADIPIVTCDARDRKSVAGVLMELVQHAMLNATGASHGR